LYFTGLWGLGIISRDTVTFEYHIEDMDCKSCVNYKGKNIKFRNGCQKEICEFFDERREAIKNGRMLRDIGL